MLHVVTVANEEYVGFVPLFLHCVLGAYPDYKATVFVRGKIPGDVLAALSSHEYWSRFSVVRGEFVGYPEGRKETASLRYLLFTPDRIGKYFSTDEYIYITDVDLMIVGEEDGIVEQHVRHMYGLGLPYSNMLRPYRPTVLTGLHFVTAEYIYAVAETTARYDAEFRARGLDVVDEQGCILDERLLYQIVRDSGIGLPPHPSEAVGVIGEIARFRPWHGVNIGFGRQKLDILEIASRYASTYAQLVDSIKWEYVRLIPSWGKKAMVSLAEAWLEEEKWRKVLIGVSG